MIITTFIERRAAQLKEGPPKGTMRERFPEAFARKDARDKYLRQLRNLQEKKGA